MCCLSVVLAHNWYYPFGMLQPERHFEAGDSCYRYGFNGKEKDNEVKGFGNWQDYGMRVYDPRLGRFPSVDPITYEYPELSPFQFASNNPIMNIDLDGLEGVRPHDATPQEPEQTTAQDETYKSSAQAGEMPDVKIVGLATDPPSPEIVNPPPQGEIKQDYSRSIGNTPALDDQHKQMARFDPAIKAIASTGLVVVSQEAVVVLSQEAVVAAKIIARQSAPKVAQAYLRAPYVAKNVYDLSKTPGGLMVTGYIAEELGWETPPSPSPDEVFKGMGALLRKAIDEFNNSGK